MGTTPILNLPYPELNDGQPPNAPAAFRALAEAAEGAITGDAPVASFPHLIQAGYATFASGTSGLTVSVVFPTPFATAPRVITQVDSVELEKPRLTTVSATGFSVRCDRAATGTYGVHWIAMVSS